MSIWAKQSSQTDAIIMAQGQSDADRDVSMFWLNNGVTKLSRHRNPGFGDSGTIDSGGLTGLRLTVANYASASSRSTSYDGVIGTANTTALTDDISLHDSIYLFGLGTNNSAGSAFFIGVIAEAHFYTKPLTQAQITALKNGTSKPEELVDTDGTTSIWIDGWQLKTVGDWTSMKNGWVLSPIGAGTIATETTLAHPVSRVTAVPVSFSGPVPTRNGVLGTASTFANAGFFAGNLTPFTYSSVGAALPAGVTLNTSTGVLSLAASGASAGTTSGIIIRATDTGGNVANTNAYSIVIAATNAAPTFPGNISNISGTAGSAITPVNISGQFSDTDTLTYSASPSGTAWPSGLVINSSTGIISGTIASASTTNGLKVRATDTNASTVDSNAFNVVITATATRTWTPTIKLEALADETPFPSQAVHAQIIDMAGNIIATKTGLVTNSVGLPPPFTTSVGALATDYRVLYVDDTDPTLFAVENLRCV